MEFRYSVQLSPENTATGGMAGSIPVRRHLSPLKEDIGALRAQKDWEKYVGPLNRFRGGLADKYGLTQVAVPECRPERLEVLAYVLEIGFLYDDCTEFLGPEEVKDANDNMQHAFSEGFHYGAIRARANGLKRIQSILFNEMVAIDKDRAIVAMTFWAEFLNESAGRQHNTVHTSLDTYLSYRVLDVGEMFWLGSVTFGMALSIPDSELPLVRKLTRPCWVVLALQNDICSYRKERDAAYERGQPHIVNALWVLMKEHGVNLDRAKELCMQHIERNVVEYQNVVLTSQHDQSLSKDARTYLESLLYTISGDAAWSLRTPRYNAGQTYNDLQLSMMKNGVEVALETLRSQPTLDEFPWSEKASLCPITPEVLAYWKYIKCA